jgi:hypothetical protein
MIASLSFLRVAGVKYTLTGMAKELEGIRHDCVSE